MLDRKMIFRVVGYGFRRWHKNPRIPVVFLMNFVLCLLLTQRIAEFIARYNTTIQITEGFIWVFGDSTSIMVWSLLLIFLFSDMPFISRNSQYVLSRTGKLNWLLGQGLYVCAATLLFVAAAFVFITLLLLPYSFGGNQWSETAAMISYSGIGEQIAVPASLHAMEGTLPYTYALHVGLLLLGYTLWMATCMMVFNMGRKRMGALAVMIINGLGLMLSPQIWQLVLHLPEAVSYKANVITGWLSLLNHATYYMHDFGTTQLPRLWVSYLFFTIGITAHLFIAYKKLKRLDLPNQLKEG